MFINRSKNKSGTTSVRVLQKRGRNNILVKSFGSSRDGREIERIVEQTKIFIQKQTGTFFHLFNPTKYGKFDCPQVLLGYWSSGRKKDAHTPKPAIPDRRR